MKRFGMILAALVMGPWLGSLPAQTPYTYPPLTEKVADSGKVTRATGVKAILVAQTDDKQIGEGCTANLAAMEMLVRSLPGFNPETDLIVLKGKEATARNFRKALKDVKVRHSESLFIYFAGHGAFGDDLKQWWDPSGGHVLQMPDEDLRRRELEQELRGKTAKLKVLITDTCNFPLPGTVWFADERDPRFKSPPRPAILLSKGPRDNYLAYYDARYVLPTDKSPRFKKYAVPAFEYLLFMHEGLVDVSGTSPGEFGYYNPDGGWFTIGLLKALEEDMSPYGELLDFFNQGASQERGREEHKAGEPCHWSAFLKLASHRARDVFATRKLIITSAAQSKDQKNRKALERLKAQPDQRMKIFQMNIIHGAK